MNFQSLSALFQFSDVIRITSFTGSVASAACETEAATEKSSANERVRIEISP